MKCCRVLATSIALVSFILVITQSSSAQVVPFKSSGDNALYFTDIAFTTATGKATHMGKMSGSGHAFPVGDPIGPGQFEWQAVDYKMTAANGDQIFMHGGGVLQFIPLGGSQYYAVWLGEFHIDGGTGRFANVSAAAAPLEVIAINDPFELDHLGQPLPGAVWSYSWEVNGKINLGKK